MPDPRVSRRQSRWAAGIAAVAAIIAFLTLVGPAEISRTWEEFKAPAGPETGDTLQRFSSASGNGRYQYWSVAVDAGEANPVTGIGPGTWEFAWARDGTLPGFVRNAHSLYFETFAELGLPGLLLVAAFVAVILGIGVRRLRRADDGDRPALAAMTAACAAFAVAAAVDWSWQLPVIPVAFVLVAAALVTANRAGSERRSQRVRGRIALVAVAIAGVGATALPLPGAIAIRSSQDSFSDGDLAAALDHAEDAERWQPYAAAPALQKALVLERAGDLAAARDAAEEAVDREAVNWRNWLILSRIEAALGNEAESEAAYARARELNPRSAIFADQ